MTETPGSAGTSLARRRLLAAAPGAALALAACTSTAPPAASGTFFALGVASGEPMPDGVVLWTRLAPDPLSADPARPGGMTPEAVPVRWEIAEDDAMRRVVRHGETLAEPVWAHSVHVEVRGLEPGRWYWYRFVAKGNASPVGRTRTAPVATARVDRLRLAAAACQDFQNGFYSAYRHMAQDDLDLVLHLGDYIYEYPGRDGAPRRYLGGEPVTLAEYRLRHAQHRADPDLQAAHAAFPWLAIPDDHDVENDYASDRSEKRTPRAAFLRRRAAAYRAYYEHMPLPPAMAPRGADFPFHRRRRFGSLLDLFLLDVRQYRSKQACPGPRFGGQVIDPARCAELADPRRTMLGAAQERWLGQQAAGSQGRWTVFAQQLLLGSLLQPMRDGRIGVWSDGWDGYPAARRRFTDMLAAPGIANPILLGGDIHSFWVADIKRDFSDPRAPTLASEFVTTSISSGLLPHFIAEAGLKLPHIRLADGRRHGYLRCTATPGFWRTDLQTVDTVARPDAALRTLKSFVVEPGRPGAQPA